PTEAATSPAAATTATEAEDAATASPTMMQPNPTPTPQTPTPTRLEPAPTPTATAEPTPVPTIEPVIEWFEVPAGSRPHDVAPAADGGVWYTGQRTGELGYLDPSTAEVRTIPLGAGSA